MVRTTAIGMSIDGKILCALDLDRLEEVIVQNKPALDLRIGGWGRCFGLVGGVLVTPCFKGDEAQPK